MIAGINTAFAQRPQDNAQAVDQPMAGLLSDLAARGLLDETLVVWAGEFGRTPFAHGSDGRDHNPFAFSIWMAGGGVRGGTTYGETDEFGYKVADKPVEMHDLHATILHLLGIDHERLDIPLWWPRSSVNRCAWQSHPRDLDLVFAIGRHAS